ncbi:unnamed protein product [Lymnaea stagnalis]|uniref:F-BAR domain-containing protein n=1 Tax=Lymnaea stagnalis TaxID=6523 RepID=A0AAV2IJ26_LYMST
MLPYENMNIKTYADSFWGGDLSSTLGYDALVKRNNASKKMCQDLEDYLKKRSKIESDYSKALIQLYKSFKEREIVGVLEAALNQLRLELEVLANHHNKAAMSFQQHSDRVKKFKDEQMSSRKAREDCLLRVQNSKITQLNKTQQLEKVYVRKCVERDAAQTSLKEMNVAQSQPKDFDKARNKASKAAEEAERADNAYKSAVMVLEDCRSVWKNEMISACQVIQHLDEERLKFLRKGIWDSLNVDSQLALDMDASSESVREIVEKCDIVSDIQAFIMSFGTGAAHPEPYLYKHYTKITGNNDNDSTGSDSSNPYNSVGDDYESVEVTAKKSYFNLLKKKNNSTSS